MPAASPRPEHGASQVAKWRSYEEKSVLFRPATEAVPGQLDDLRTLARTLQRARVSKAERITENSLIRVAVDVLLAVQDRLHGDTEDQLRDSLLRGGGQG